MLYLVCIIGITDLHNCAEFDVLKCVSKIILGRSLIPDDIQLYNKCIQEVSVSFCRSGDERTKKGKNIQRSKNVCTYCYNYFGHNFRVHVCDYLKNAAKDQNVDIRALRQAVQRDQKEYTQDVNFKHRYYDPTIMKVKRSFSFEEVRNLLKVMGHDELPKQFRSRNCFKEDISYHEVCFPHLVQSRYGAPPSHAVPESGPCSTVYNTDSPNENQPKKHFGPQTYDGSGADSEPHGNTISETPLCGSETTPEPPRASFQHLYPDRHSSSRHEPAAKRTRKYVRIVRQHSSSSSSDEGIGTIRSKTPRGVGNPPDEEVDIDSPSAIGSVTNASDADVVIKAPPELGTSRRKSTRGVRNASGEELDTDSQFTIERSLRKSTRDFRNASDANVVIGSPPELGTSRRKSTRNVRNASCEEIDIDLPHTKKRKSAPARKSSLSKAGLYDVPSSFKTMPIFQDFHEYWVGPIDTRCIHKLDKVGMGKNESTAKHHVKNMVRMVYHMSDNDTEFKPACITRENAADFYRFLESNGASAESCSKYNISFTNFILCMSMNWDLDWDDPRDHPELKRLTLVHEWAAAQIVVFDEKRREARRVTLQSDAYNNR